MKKKIKKISKINFSNNEVIEKNQLRTIIGGNQSSTDQGKLDGILNLIR